MYILCLILIIGVASANHNPVCDRVWYLCAHFCAQSPGDCHRCSPHMPINSINDGLSSMIVYPDSNWWNTCCQYHNVCDSQNRLILGRFHIVPVKSQSYKLVDEGLMITNVYRHTCTINSIECPSDNFAHCENGSCRCVHHDNNNYILEFYSIVMLIITIVCVSICMEIY